MTISLADNTPRISYAVAQGVTQTSFTVPFEFFDSGDLKVYVDGTLKTITTHYTVSGGDGSTGTIALSVTGASGGSTVVITRDIPLARTTDFPTSGAFAVATLNRELDRFTAMQADRADDNDRSIKLKDQDATSSMELPLKADRVGKYLRFNETSGDIEPVAQAVDTGGITSAMLADSAVTTAKINDGAVTAAKLDSASVTTAKIADTGVTGAKLNTDAISAQTALTSGLAATDELLVSDGGTLKRMDVSVVTDYYKDLSVTETNKTLTSAVLNGTISGTSIKDEDDMSSNSASHLATQQSIKAYVDATVTAEDLDVATDSGNIDIDLDSESLTIAGGEGIDTSATSTTVTISAETATASNLGVASFSSDNFDVSSGAVSIKDGGVVTAELAADAVTGAKIADDSIDSEHFVDGSIDTAHIADAQITTAKIAADAITSAKIADDAISEEHLDPSIISSLADTTIASADHLMFLDATDGALKKVDAGELGVGAALTDIVGDTTPQLGGNLDVNGNEITSASNGNIVVNPNGTGTISLSADVGIGATPNTYSGFTTVTIGGSGASDLDFEHNGTVICSLFTEASDFDISATNDLVLQTGGNNDRIRLNTAGDFLVAKASQNTNEVGHELRADGVAVFTADGAQPVFINRKSSDGAITKFAQDDTVDGQINTKSGDINIGTGDTGIRFNDGLNALQPFNCTTNAFINNTLTLGSSGAKFNEIFCGNATINTSDENVKQDIASLNDKEIKAATAISKLFKTYKYKDSVASKGDDARIHTGVIAQQVRTALEAEGLDASKYSFWCSDTWWEHSVEVPAVEAVEAITKTKTDENGNEVQIVMREAVEAQDAFTRIDDYYTADEAPEGSTQKTQLGIRYPELLAFVGAATEQRLTSIESRLTALEG